MCAVYVGVDIGGTKIACGLVRLGDAEPAVEAVEQVPTEAARGGKQVLTTVIAQVFAAVSRSSEPPVGVGISTAGVVDPFTGDVTYANDLMPGWGGTRLGVEVATASGLPVRVLNDVHAHALGECRWGAGRGAESCLVIAMGTGIGGAFFENGTIMLGSHNEAGHIGHLCCSQASGVPCSCGATGHLEPIAAGPGIVARYLELGGTPTCDDGTPVGGAEIDRRAAAGDAAAIEAERRSGLAIGEVLGSLCNMLDPSCIILSGSVAQCGVVWHSALAESWRMSVMPPVAATPIYDGKLGGDAPLIGAVEHAIRPAYREILSTLH